MYEQIVGVYMQGTASGSELDKAIKAALEEILQDPAAREELRGFRVDEDDLREIKFTVKQKPGIGPGAVIIAIAVAAAGELAADGAKALWRLVLRRVKQREGTDAL